MPFVSVRRVVLGSGLALALSLTAGLATAAPVTPEPKDKPAGSAETIRKALDQTMTLDISEQPLTQALNKIREQTKINFVIDKMFIQQMGYDPDTMPVTVKLKDAKARTCLRSVLSPYNLGYAILGDTLLISTEDMVMQRQMKQRVTVDLDKVDLSAALKQLSKETATNLMLDTRVAAKDTKATVTLQLEDVPLETAVKLVAEAGGLKHVQVGNVMMVTTKALANEMKSDPELMQGAMNPQQEMQMLQQRRQQMLQMQQLQGQLFVPVNPPPQAVNPPPVEVEKKADPKDPPPEEKKSEEKKPDDKKPDDKKPDDKKGDK
jgi:hypothetical protein